MPVLAFGILSSGSRAALGAMVVLGLIVGPLTRNRVVFAALLSGAGAILLLFSLGVVKPEGENALGRALGDSVTAEGSDSIREALQENVWDRFVARPLTGNGFNYMRPSHNVYLGLIASAGVLGVVGLAIIVSTVVRRLWRKRSDLLLASVTAAYLAYLCNAYFDNIFWWRWLWFYVGLVLAVGATRRSSSEAGAIDDGADADDGAADDGAAADGAADGVEVAPGRRRYSPASTR
jgi:O-antigen ligase